MTKCSAFRIANPQWNVADDVVNLTYTVDQSVLFSLIIYVTWVFTMTVV